MAGRPRVEATVTDSQSQAVQQIADQMGLSRSEVVGEALGLYVKIFMEAKLGHRLVTLDPKTQRPVCELVTPTLAALEWTLHQEPIEVSPEAMNEIQQIIAKPPAPTVALRKGLAKRKR